MLSTPSLSLGSLNFALGGYEALPAGLAGAAFPCPARIPTAAAAATAKATSHTSHRVPDALGRLMCFICVRLLSMSRGATRGLSCPAMVEPTDAHSHRGDPPVFDGKRG